VPPKIYKLYSLITRESVSEEGWSVDIDGEDYTFAISQLEKKVNVPSRNRLICEEFLKYALKTPDGSIGKTIVFAVSQDHAAALAKELNARMPEMNGRFAQVITSRLKGSSDLAKAFRKDENYWPRIAVSVDMLSTGYDCPEILNIVLARPIASPTNYIQIKGRGTRRYTFPDGSQKTKFIIHDFCEVVEYFEEEYDYNAPLPIPVPVHEAPVVGEEMAQYSQKAVDEHKADKGILVAKTPDKMVMTEFIEVGPEGEKVDRMHYQQRWKEKIQEVATEKPEIIEAARTDSFTDELMEYLNTEVLNRPIEYFNETNLAKVYRIFADITEFIKEALGIGKLPTQKEQLEELIEFLKVEYSLNLSQIRLLRVLIEQLIQSPKYAEQFEKGDFQFLNNQPFASYGGVGAYVSTFGDITKPVFTHIKQSHPLKLALMR
jgi:type I restriction enzyme R subunit